MGRRAGTARWKALALGAAGVAVGCHTADTGGPRPFQLSRPILARRAPAAAPTYSIASEAVPDFALPKELNKVALPAYVIEISDVLGLDAVRLVPQPPYRVEVGDVLYLFAPGAPEREPIRGYYPVDADGTIHLGPGYGGRIAVAGLPAPQIEVAVGDRLRQHLRDPAVQVTVAQARGLPPIRGDYPVRPDGTIGLGTYGSVYVAGMSAAQAKEAVEKHLAQSLERPEVAVELRASNSKFVYAIADFGPTAGQQVVQVAWKGNETVLDAVAQLGKLPGGAEPRVWVARPAPNGVADQILPVDWAGISRRGQTRTNYQLLPGDRVFVTTQPAAAPASPTANCCGG